MSEAFVTLATNDAYAVGCLALARSLRKSGTTRQLVVMVTSDVTFTVVDYLTKCFNYVKVVSIMDSGDVSHLQLLGRPELGVTLTKINCWLLTNYTKCVFLDADTLVLQNIDDLFLREELSAAPDVGWPDCFNSGVFVFKPSYTTYQSLKQFALNCPSFDGGDQGLLNMYFDDWSTKDLSHHLPFMYNVVPTSFYSYLPAFIRFKNDIKIVHFIGPIKPWHYLWDINGKLIIKHGDMPDNHEFLEMWMSSYMEWAQENEVVYSPSLLLNLSVTALLSRRKTWTSEEMHIIEEEPFEHIQKKLDDAMQHGTYDQIVDATKTSLKKIDIALLTNTCIFRNASTQVKYDEILAELPRVRVMKDEAVVKTETPVEKLPIQPPTQAVEEMLIQPPIQPPTQAVEEMLIQPPIQPPTQAVEEMLIQPPIQPPTQAVEEMLIQPPIQPPTQAVEEMLIQPPTQAVEEMPIQPPIQPPTQASMQVSTEVLTYPPTSMQVSTEVLTYPLTQPPMQVSTEVQTQPPIQPPIQPPTQRTSQLPTQVALQHDIHQPIQPLIQPLVQSPTQTLIQPPTKLPTQPPIQPPTQRTSQLPTQVALQRDIHQPIQPLIQPLVQSPTQTLIQPPTKLPTRPPIQPPTQRTSQLPTQVALQRDIHQPIQPLIQPLVQSPTQTLIQPPTKLPSQPRIEPTHDKPTVTMPQKPTKPKVVVKSVTKPEGEPLGEIWTRVDIDNANRMLTKVSADKDSSAKFRVKSITGEAAKESMKMSKDANLMEGSDTVKMLLEFQCQYCPRKNVFV